MDGAREVDAATLTAWVKLWAPIAKMGETLEYVKMFARFPFALRRFLREPVSLDDAERIVCERMKARADNFLRVLEQSVYGVPHSPYLALLNRAGYSFQAVRALVRACGLEAALRELREADVYVTYQEFKGREPIVRKGFERPVTPRDFDNPHARRDFALTTGGSTGLANTVYQDLDHIATLAVNEVLLLDAHGLLDAAPVHWTHMLPGSGIRFILQRAYGGRREQKWFAPIGWREFQAWRKYDAATLYMLAWMRAAGLRVPIPEIVRPDNALVVARYLRKVLDAEGKAVLYSNVSQAVRVALAAAEAGFDLTGAAARLMSEPLTDAKAERIHRVGMHIISGYGSIETAAIGIGCAAPPEVDDVHLEMDAFALIDYAYAVPKTDLTVPAFNLTSLRETTPKVMLNYQSDDYGIVETRSCGCPLEVYGYTTHLHHIRSYSKLVGEGVTLIGNEMLKILEEQFPARFGGTPLDYQIVEREDEQGLTRLALLIHPRVVIEDESAVIPFLLNALRASSPAADAARTVWQRAGTLQLERRAPIVTSRGKLLPLHIQRTPDKF